MKPKWVIEIEVFCNNITASVYVYADTVKAVSHERIEADGVIIDLPGNITSCFKKD